MHFEKHIK